MHQVRSYLAVIVISLVIVAGGDVHAARAQAEPLSTPAPTLLAQIAQAAATLGPDEVDHALLAATQDHALPDGYVPPDLVSLAAAGIPQREGASIRRVVFPDLQGMVQSAQQDGVELRVSSAYRSYSTQVSTYAFFANTRGSEWADTRSARPGHSQHQLGTAIDFNTPGAFAASPAGQWLWLHAHAYGFVFPYTPASAARTGYVFEPWHLRWIGRELAQLIWQQGYQDSSDLIADDYVALARDALLPRAAVPTFVGAEDQRG